MVETTGDYGILDTAAIFPKCQKSSVGNDHVLMIVLLLFCILGRLLKSTQLCLLFFLNWDGRSHNNTILCNDIKSEFQVFSRVILFCKLSKMFVLWFSSSFLSF